MMFDRSHYARFLKAHNFDADKALEAFKQYLQWRKSNQVDVYLDAEFAQINKIKAFLPNGWFENDKEGNPLFILNLGQASPKKLLSVINSETLMKYFFSEIEHTWRMKF
jgi:hypothetical protein